MKLAAERVMADQAGGDLMTAAAGVAVGLGMPPSPPWRW